MKRRYLIWLFTPCLLLLYGCETVGAQGRASSNQAYEAALSGWAGQSPYTLRDAWGKAQDSEPAAEGRIALLYQKQYIYKAGDYVVPSGENYEVPAPGGGMALAVNSDPKVYPSHSRDVQRTCITQFTLNSEGRIASVNAIGACRPGDLSHDRLPPA